MPDIPSTSTHQLLNALKTIGHNRKLHDTCLNMIKTIENETASRPDYNVREEVTGPIMDAVFASSDKLYKTIDNGLKFEFLYRSKIARDFLLSEPETPDHIFEPQTTKLLGYLSGFGGDILIGGAYFGDHAILAAHAIQRNGFRVHAFEPSNEQLDLLIQNQKINGLDNINPVNLGLWNKDDTLLHLVGDDAYAYAVEYDRENPPEDGTFSFKATSINAYGLKNQVKRLGTILLDIEGSELNALKGGDRYLAQPATTAPNIIFEVHRQFVDWSDGLDQTDIVKYLNEMGYLHIYAIRDFQSNVNMKDCKVELVPLTDIYLEGPPHGFNMIAVKNGDILDDKIFRFTPGVSPKLLLHKDPALHHPTEWL